MLIDVNGGSEDNLAQIGCAASLAGALLGARQGWKQERRQNRDDGCDDEKFNEGETSVAPHSTI
jgi:hypothetical protein